MNGSFFRSVTLFLLVAGTLALLPDRLDAQRDFIRSDCNSDGTVSGQVSDAIFLLTWLFGGGPTPSCVDACDPDDDGAVRINDALYLLGYLFAGGPPPRPPFPDCGRDPTDQDGVSCDAFPACDGTFEIVKIAPRGRAANPARVTTTPSISVTFNDSVEVASVMTGTNVTLEEEATGAPMGVALVATPNSSTLLFQPTSPLSVGTRYVFKVHDGPGSVRDTSSPSRLVDAAATTVLETIALPPERQFEARHYLKTLGRTQWEFFPLTAPTANGRDGFAVVLPTTRRLYLTATDVTTPGRQLAVDITRIYRNNLPVSTLNTDPVHRGLFGNNWFFPYDCSFEVIPDQTSDGNAELRHRSMDGRFFDYVSRPADGLDPAARLAYVSPPGFYDTLNAVGDLLVQRNRNGTKFFYELHRPGDPTVVSPASLTAADVGVVGFLVRIEDCNRNTIHVRRFPANDAVRSSRVRAILDDLDRTTTFSYSTVAGQQDLVVKIEQFETQARRTWLYSYDANRSLVSVETPVTTFLPDGAATPVTARKRHDYTYSLTGNAANLTSVTDGRGNASMRFFYDTNGDVIQVDHGTGADSGTARYSYQRESGVNRACQIDRNGNVCVVDNELDPSFSNFWTPRTATVFTRGLHPSLPGGEPSSYTTLFGHDSDTELVQLVLPEDNVVCWIRDECGCPVQEIHKAATFSELQGDSDARVEEDIVIQIDVEPLFSQPIRMFDARANHRDFVGLDGENIVDQRENVIEQTPRTYTNLNHEQRNALTTLIYYDHENVEDRASLDSELLQGRVALVRDFPVSFGRTTGPPFRDPAPGNLVFADLDEDGFPDRGGNPVAVRSPSPRTVSQACLLAPGRQVVERHFAYNRYGQPIYEIEPDGDRVRLEFRGGAFDLLNNPGRGYLAKVDVASRFLDTDLDPATGDPRPSGPSGTGLSLITSFTHDHFGNVLTVTNPRGFVTTREVNALNLVARTVAPKPFQYERAYLYDGNNNLRRRDRQNVAPLDLNDDGLQTSSAEQQEDPAHPYFVDNYTYNTANSLRREELDAFGSSPARLITEYRYDRKQLPIAEREPEGNEHLNRYDERDLVVEHVEGASDPAQSERTRFDYNGNGLLIQELDDDGNTGPDLVVSYDTFDRPVSWTDEIGNRVEVVYDVASLERQRTVRGQARGDPGDGTDTVLENTLTEYDELKRPFQTTRELFDTAESLASLGLVRLTPIVDLGSRRKAGGELVNTLRSYDPDGNLVRVCDDNNHTTTFNWDEADRLVAEEDHLGSVRVFDYDLASNVIRTTDIERSAGGSVIEIFYTEQYWDEVDRLIATVSHLGNTRRYLYDSRDNLVQKSDAMGAVAAGDLGSLRTASEHGTFPQITALTTPPADPRINQRGNTIRYEYDGLNRLLAKIRHLRADGTGGTAVAGQVVTSQTWDGNSRVATRSDPNGNPSTYHYDHQNRLIRKVYADATEMSMTWNRIDTVASRVDPRGVVEQYGYDAAERRVSMNVSQLPPGEGQTTFASWLWDGLDRNTRAEDDDSINEYFFDSLSRQIDNTQRLGTGTPRASPAESLSGEVVGVCQWVYDGVGNLLVQVYPRSGRRIRRAFDEVDRLEHVRDVTSAATVATFSYIGQGARRLRRFYPTPSVECRLGYDGERRVVRQDNVRTTDDLRVRGFAYAWNREDLRRFERRLPVNTNPLEGAGPGEAYRYDSIYRLVHDDRDVGSADLDAVKNNRSSVVAPPVDPGRATDYVLDEAGNRREATVDGILERYLMQAGAPGFDAAMNQYTRIGSQARSHDAAGNTLSGAGAQGGQRFFDSDNQLVQWTDGAKDVRYRYDVDGRRFLKEDAGAGSFVRTLYFYDGWQCVEETDAAGVVLKTYVYGDGIDEVLRATLPDAADLDGDLDTAESVDLFYHHNSIGSVVAVTDATGNVVESYRYASYGKTRVFDQSGIEVPGTRVEQPYMFTGRRLDFEEDSGLYYYRLRYYDPAAGRFISRDPVGNWGDPSQRGNAQNYCGNDPVNCVDPLGDNDIFPNPKYGPVMVPAGDPDPGDFFHCRFCGRIRSKAPPYASGPICFGPQESGKLPPSSEGGDASALGRKIVRGVASGVPFANDGIDAWEIRYGKDAATGETLSTFDRIVSCGALIFGSAWMWRAVSRKADDAAEELETLLDLFDTVRARKLRGDLPGATERIVEGTKYPSLTRAGKALRGKPMTRQKRPPKGSRTNPDQSPADIADLEKVKDKAIRDRKVRRAANRTETSPDATGTPDPKKLGKMKQRVKQRLKDGEGPRGD